MHEGTIVTDTAGNVTEMSVAAERILETPSPQVIGKAVSTLFVMPQTYDEVLSSAAKGDRVLNRSVVLQTGDGKRKIVNLSAQRAGEGAGTRIVHVFQDCADVRTLEQRLLQAERLATVGKFASQVAHEIRNPLSSISLNLELLEDQLDGAGDDARNLLRSALREMDRLNDIVAEYLQFSRFPKPNLKRGRVEGAIEEFVNSNSRLRSGVRWETAFAAASPEVWFDESLLKQVVENLTRNAIEAMNGEGVLRIETETTDRFVVIRVRDNGCGISPDHLSKLFEPFFTTKTQGTGLGLATSQQIIFEHNGHLLVDSLPGKGTTFTILLPTT